MIAKILEYKMNRRSRTRKKSHTHARSAVVIFAAGFFFSSPHQFGQFLSYTTQFLCIFFICADSYCVVRILFVLSSSGQKPFIITIAIAISYELNECLYIFNQKRKKNQQQQATTNTHPKTLLIYM